MKIAFCSAEVEPFAKVGGLADVAGSLPKALAALGHEVIVFMPAYGMVVKDPKWRAKLLRTDLLVKVNGFRLERAKLWEIVHDGVKVWLIDGAESFEKVQSSVEVYSPGRDDYLFFSRAFMEACVATNWIPDVVSVHDWQMGFIPVMLRHNASSIWAKTAATYTIHNLAYQGEFGFDTLDAAGVDHDLYDMHQLETYGSVNFLKAGCVFADAVNTVSPNYAKEIQTAEYGCRLEGLMAHLAKAGRLRGILNGIDVGHHDPERDPRLAANFSTTKMAGKAECRLALTKELGLKLGKNEPLLTVISRLSNQKGFDLMVEGADQFMKQGCGWVVLGTGDPWAASQLRSLEAKYPGKIRFVEAFDAELAQRIYSAGDIFLMPSAFEPCGLGQLFAMRYGNIPVVRRTGGLADTVHDGENGFVFETQDTESFVRCVTRAIDAFRGANWSNLVAHAMNEDFSWSKSARAYDDLYANAYQLRLSAVVENGKRIASKAIKSGAPNGAATRK